MNTSLMVRNWRDLIRPRGIHVEPETLTEHGKTPLTFHVVPPVSGPVKFFLHVERGGITHTIPFGQMIAPAISHAQRVETSHSQHHSAAIA